jgi:hypothetical protein
MSDTASLLDLHHTLFELYLGNGRKRRQRESCRVRIARCWVDGEQRAAEAAAKLGFMDFSRVKDSER